MGPVLELSGIHKSFDGAVALAGATFAARAGEVHALLGENGAGKSSLMNVAAGVYAPDAWTVSVAGRIVDLAGPAAARRHGIGMVHQHFKLVKSFTVAENVLLANPRPRYRAGMPEICEAIRRQAEDLGFAIEPERRVDALNLAEQQQVEIVKVLVGGARILILDEPTAVLTDAEADRLLTTIRRLARNGATVVLVTHKLDEVKRHADAVTVMRAGRTVATLDPRNATVAKLTELTVGHAVAAPSRAEAHYGPTRLDVRALTCARADGRVTLKDASFFVRGGEIYGIAGVSGNGQAELAEALIGARVPLAGEIRIDGVGDVGAAPPAVRRNAGLAAIPADRDAYALAGALSVADNFAAASIRHYGPALLVNGAAMRRDAAAAVAAYDVQGVRSVTQKAALLSGGNGQKLVIAREFSRTPVVVVAQSPSHGLDARATAAVYERLLAVRDGGAAVVLISHDLDEIMALSDRIGVMTRGR